MPSYIRDEMYTYMRAKTICNIKMFNYVTDDTNTNKASSYQIDVGFLFGDFGTSLIKTLTNRSTVTQTPTLVVSGTNTIDGIEIPTFNAISLHFNICKKLNNGNEISTNQCHHGCPLNHEILFADRH